MDLDGDGYISYEDYFVFLKEYFGSKRASAAIDPPVDKPQPPPPQPPPQDDFAVHNSACERFAKLIYNQLKITAMQIDYNHKMKFEV